jgi:hypothetical protein
VPLSKSSENTMAENAMFEREKRINKVTSPVCNADLQLSKYFL